MEGNYRTSKILELKASDFSGGVEKRFGENVLTSFEGFFHERGYTNPESYAHLLTIRGTEGNLGRFYLGLGVDWQAEPLTSLKVLVQGNLSDQSVLTTTRILHSLSQVSEAGLTLILPYGQTPEEGTLKSEFGSYPVLVQAEVTINF